VIAGAVVAGTVTVVVGSVPVVVSEAVPSLPVHALTISDTETANVKSFMCTQHTGDPPIAGWEG
jgi:hypothetical protein